MLDLDKFINAEFSQWKEWAKNILSSEKLPADVEGSFKLAAMKTWPQLRDYIRKFDDPMVSNIYFSILDDAVTTKAICEKCIKTKCPEVRLIEKLADFEHKQWIYWTKGLVKMHGVQISPDRLSRWKRLWKIPYSKLTEEWKEADRKYARKVAKILKS